MGDPGVVRVTLGRVAKPCNYDVTRVLIMHSRDSVKAPSEKFFHAAPWFLYSRS